MVTQTSQRTTFRRRARHALVRGSLAVTLVALAACGDDAGTTDTVTSPAQQALAAAVETSAATSFRFEVRFSAGSDASADTGSPGDAAREPAMEGTSAGGWVHTSMDLGAGMGAIADASGGDVASMPAPGAVTVETITDGEVLYMHWPMLAQADERPARPGDSLADTAARAALAPMGEGWGRIEIDSQTPRTVQQIAGMGLVDPHSYLDLVANGRDAEDVGTQQIDGVETRTLRADVTLEAMAALQNPAHRQEMEESLAELVDGDELDELVDEIMAVESAVEVWVDDDEHVRRVVTTFDAVALYDVIRDVATDVDPDELGVLTTTLDMFDHDDPTVGVAEPATWTDVTDAVTHLVGSAGL